MVCVGETGLPIVATAAVSPASHSALCRSDDFADADDVPGGASAGSGGFSACRSGAAASATVLVQTRGMQACVSKTVRYRHVPRITFQISGAVAP